MPTYEFKCCDNSVSVNASMSEIKTPTCGKCLQPMARVYSIQGIKFKGSGFYTTDKREDT